MGVYMYSVYGGFNTGYYALVHGICFFEVFPMECIGLMFACAWSTVHRMLK